MKNTGRPFNADNKYTSKYLDVENTPLYPFGYGLSYTRFSYSPITLSKNSMTMGDSVTASVTVTNQGDRAGAEVVQLYIRDLVGSVTRPVKELKGFDKIYLEPGEEKRVEFTISSDDLAFYTRAMTFKAEPGDFEVFIGGSSAVTEKAAFSLSEPTN
jgi:beta-glucosidase